MRMAYIVWEYPPHLVGGLGTYAAEITRQFVLMGDEIEVFTINPGSLPPHEQRETLSIRRHPLVEGASALPIFVNEEVKRWGPGQRFFFDLLTHNIVAATDVVQRMREQKYDLIVYHDFLSAIAGGIATETLGVPSVFHIHSTEHGRNMGGGSPTVKEMEYFGAAKATRIVTVSNAMKEELSRLYFPVEKVRVCWNGVDEEKYNPAHVSHEQQEATKKKYGVPLDAPVVTFVGRLTRVKGIDTLIRAIDIVRQRYRNIRLLVLGKGEMEAELRYMIGNLNLSDNVILITQWVPEEERIRLYSIADVVAAPSRYEPFGIVPLEAMAMEKPVVGGEGGIRETVVHGVTGYHIDPQNPSSIATAILQLLENERERRQMGRAARERVLSLFTWKRIAENTRAIYEEVMKSRR